MKLKTVYNSQIAGLCQGTNLTSMRLPTLEGILTKISIIIPVWNLWHTTLDCLESIAATSVAELDAQALEIIVVDNGSTDETTTALAPTLKRLFGACAKVLRMPENLGFAKACNAGAKAATHPLLFFLNNDTVAIQDWLYPLLQAFESNPQLGAVGPLLLYPDDTVQHYGICSCPISCLHHIYAHLPAEHPVVNKPRAFQAITGAAILVIAELFWECGGFYEEYINGYEDVDLCYSIRKKGFYCASIPQSRIYHLTSKTPGRFEHEAYNTNIFNGRYPHKKPDLHTIVNEDGLIPTFGPMLDSYIALPEIDEQALTVAFSKNFDLQRCKDRLLAEPFWFGGYELLVDYYEKQGQHLHVVTTLIKLINLNPQLKYFARIKRMSEYVDPHMLKRIITFEQYISSATTRIEDLKQKIAMMQGWANKTGDTVLNSMVEQWLQKYT